jgi:hypothetical protein
MKFRAIAGKIGFIPLVLSAAPICAQSFRTQCPSGTAFIADRALARSTIVNIGASGALRSGRRLYV